MDAVVQSEAAECGLACIAMVAAAHGNAIGLRELRRRHAVSLKGATLSQIIAVAEKLHFTCRPLRLELGQLGQLQLPCILHWDMDHFVVLSRVGRKGVTVLDPASGVKRLRFETVSKCFTGVALELTPGVEFKREPASQSISLSQLTGRIRGGGAHWV